MYSNDIRVDPTSTGGHLRMLLTGFKACKLEQVDFQIKYIKFVTACLDILTSTTLQMSLYE